MPLFEDEYKWPKWKQYLWNTIRLVLFFTALFAFSGWLEYRASLDTSAHSEEYVEPLFFNFTPWSGD